VSPRGFDPVSLVSGLVTVALGSLLVLHHQGTIDLNLGWAAAAVAAAVGMILLVSGLAARSRRD
jgi:hypothetical protein